MNNGYETGKGTCLKKLKIYFGALKLCLPTTDARSYFSRIKGSFENILLYAF